MELTNSQRSNALPVISDMTKLTFKERRQLLRLQLDRTRRRAHSTLLHTPLMRWQFGAPVADELLLVPQDLRSADPSFADEIEQRLFGLGGTVASLGDGSVFDIHPPNDNWSGDLHGFAWLRHLRAAHSDTAKAFAIEAVRDWIARHSRRGGQPWSPEFVGRRIYAWLANADLILSGAEPEFYDLLADSMGRQMIHLAAHWRSAPPGHPRLVALIGLLAGAICVAGHDKLADRVERELAGEA